MQKRILILSVPDDFHALAMQTLLRKHNAEADIVDAADFPVALALSHQESDVSEIRLGERLLADYHAVWNRRVMMPRPSPDIHDPREAQFAARECSHALWGALQASGLPLYNRPEAEMLANRKPYQLHMARKAGLTIPDTLITTSAEHARAFAQKHQHVVYKGFGPTDLTLTDTRPLTEKDMPDLWRLRYAPVILQEYVERGREYRVTLVEDDCFAAEILLGNSEARFDWRLDDTHALAPVTLPAELCARLQHLRKSLALHSGSIDLRETPDGTVHFLEINPSGQFLFLDIFAGTPIAARFCEMLLQ